MSEIYNADALALDEVCTKAFFLNKGAGAQLN